MESEEVDTHVNQEVLIVQSVELRESDVRSSEYSMEMPDTSRRSELKELKSSFEHGIYAEIKTLISQTHKELYSSEIPE